MPKQFRVTKQFFVLPLEKWICLESFAVWRCSIAEEETAQNTHCPLFCSALWITFVRYSIEWLQWKLFKEPRQISATWHTPRTGFFRNKFLMRLQGIFYWLYLIETLTQTQFVNSHLSFVTRFVIKQWVCNSLCSFVSLCIAKYVELSARKSFTPKLLIYISKLVAEIAQ